MGEVLGWLGAMCFAACGVPQAWKCYKDGHAEGLSLWFMLLWLGGEVFYVAAILIDFGFIAWMMFNYAANFVCIMVMGWYYFRPRNVV